VTWNARFERSVWRWQEEWARRLRLGCGREQGRQKVVDGALEANGYDVGDGKVEKGELIEAISMITAYLEHRGGTHEIAQNAISTISPPKPPQPRPTAVVLNFMRTKPCLLVD
jgi:hypothetical protein